MSQNTRNVRIVFNCIRNNYSQDANGKDAFLGYEFNAPRIEKEILKTISYVLARLNEYKIPFLGLRVEETNKNEINTTKSIDSEIENKAQYYLQAAKKDNMVK